jgi:hypothetical protein
MQINGFWTPWLIERGIITSAENLLQADVNLRAALEIYNYGVDRYGYGWGPWSATNERRCAWNQGELTEETRNGIGAHETNHNMAIFQSD